MLKEIYCELLKTKTRPSGKIIFHNGLNVILGSKVGTTSIGKSTSLLIIDFVFGGDTYSKSDAVKELGNHTLYILLLTLMAKTTTLLDLRILLQTLASLMPMAILSLHKRKGIILNG